MDRQAVIDACRQAIETDRSGDFAGALALYKTAISMLLAQIKGANSTGESNAAIQRKLRDKAKELLTRAEAIKESLGKSESTVSPLPLVPEPTLPADFESVVVTGKPTLQLADVCGLDAVKPVLMETVILPARFPQLFPASRMPYGAFLLYGLSGCGKTTLAKACAGEAFDNYYQVSIADLLRPIFGDSERILKTLFQLARKTPTSLVCIKDVDLCIGFDESERPRRLKTELLVQLQDIVSPTYKVTVILTTSYPCALDRSILRRVYKSVYLPLPDAALRRLLLQKAVGDLRHTLTEEQWKLLSVQSDLMTPAEIQNAVRDAVFRVIKKLSSEGREVVPEHEECIPLLLTSKRTRLHTFNLSRKMGDCTSKPNYIEVENHVKYTSSVNDAFFHEAVLLPPKERQELLAGLDAANSDSQSSADAYLYSLNNQLLKTTQRLNSDEERSKVKLVAEIRKGMDIYPVGSAKPKGVFVRVSTKPTVKQSDTTLSEAYIPKWYSLQYFLFTQGEQVNALEVSVYSRSASDEDTLFATASLDLSSTTDQTTTQWYLLHLSEPFSGLRIKPQLEIRIWLLQNQYSFWYHVKESLEQEIGLVSAALTKSRTGLPT